MSSGSRSEALENLLAAKYELEYCEDSEKEERMREFDRHADLILGKNPTISRGDLLEAIRFKYKEYKIARLRAQRRRETI